jgi:APA family basic amino acid/polyamine antiporter
MKLIILVFIGAVSFFYMEKSNFQPFLIPEQGLYGILQGASLIFYGYLGFDIMTAVSEEARNPTKDIPKSIVHSIFYVMAIYTIISFTMAGYFFFSQYLSFFP